MKIIKPLLNTSLGRFSQKFLSTSLGFGLQQILRATDLKIAYYDQSVDPGQAAYNEHCIFVFWHENMAILLPRWSNTPTTLLVSQHRDAQLLKETADFLGFNVVRGSSTRGGSAAIRQLKKQGKLASFAITPDGPQGPRREMAMGPIFMASLLRMPLVPVGVGYENPIRFNTWDRFAIPKPMTRARVVFGPKIYLPRKMPRPVMEESRYRAQNLLNEINDFATTWAKTSTRVIQEKPFVRARRCRWVKFDKPPVRSVKRRERQAA